MTKSEILKGIELTKELDAGYASSLEGPRTRGSTTDKGLIDLPEDYEISLMDDQSLAGPGTAIYQGPSGNLGGRVGALPLSHLVGDTLSMNTTGRQIMARIGSHGPELYLDRDAKELPGHGTLTFIIATDGNPDGLKPGALVTWYPGEPSSLQPKEVVDKIEDAANSGGFISVGFLPCSVMVKLHRG